MEEQDLILKRISDLKPVNVLDLGCGCGSFTAQLSPHCGRITAIDFSQALIDRCKNENGKPNIDYVCMDGRELRYHDNSFDLVLERDTLHHVEEWQKMLGEMIRVSAKHILVQEPIDDPRSDEKKNAARARRLYLDLQHEVGYSHYDYLSLDSLTGYFHGRGIPVESEIIRSDKLVDFDEFFGSFGDFAEKSDRKQYWFDKLESLRRDLGDKRLCEEDIVFIAAMKS